MSWHDIFQIIRAVCTIIGGIFLICFALVTTILIFACRDSNHEAERNAEADSKGVEL